MPASSTQDDARHGLQQHPIFFRHLLAAAHEDAARLVHQRRFRAGGDEVHDRVLQRLAVDRVVFVPDDQVDGESLHPPVGVSLHGLADQLDARVVADADQHDRQIAGDAVAPQPRLPAAVADQHAGLRPAQRGGVDDRAGQPAVRLGVGLAGVELPQQDLAVRPGQFEDAVGQARVVSISPSAP